MKRIKLSKPGGLNNLVVAETKIPEPKENEVLIKVANSSLNYHDLLVALGGIPTDDGRVPLSDCAGEIVALGSKAKKWDEGKKVISCCYPNWISGPPEPNLLSFIGDNQDGYATEYIAFSEDSITEMPEKWTFKEAATLPCAALTAWHALIDRGGLKPGQTVLTLGTGGVSIFALQLAKSMGAHVIATSSSNEKCLKLKEIGADEVINYSEHEQWGKEVLKLTNGKGVDHVVEVGGGMTFNESIRSAKFGGHVALIGVLTGPSVSEIVLPRVFMKQLNISGIAMANHESQKAMVKYLNSCDFKPIISDTFSMVSLAEAFQYQLDKKHFGKISISMH